MKKLAQNESTYKILSKQFIKLLFFVSIIFVCIYLGLWQIDRGNQKTTIYNNYKKNLNTDPIIVRKLNGKFSEFVKLRVFGEFMSGKQFLLDNRVVNKKAGYEVITPYRVGDKIVLVNRGWIKSNYNQTTPDISIKKPNDYVDGYVFYHRNLIQLKDDVYRNEWPKVVQNIEINKISALLNSKLEPYILVMTDNQENIYTHNRKYKKNTELKHYMYAGQWFLFAIVALFFAFKLLGRSKNEKKSN